MPSRALFHPGVGRRALPRMCRAGTGGCRASASQLSGANVGRRHLLFGMLGSPRDDLPHRFETKTVLTDVSSGRSCETPGRTAALTPPAKCATPRPDRWL